MRVEYGSQDRSQFTTLHQKFNGSQVKSGGDHQDTGEQVDPNSGELTRSGGGKQDKVGTFPGREGYDPDFLGVHLPMPELDESIKDTVAPLLSDPTKSELKYTHFSVIQSKERRCPLVTGVNIDGGSIQDLERKGKWVLDGRIDRDHQMGNEAYSDNDIDKGHQVRRRDPMWGPEAAKAGGDTFVYTNSGLQHADLNQRPWLDMEDYVIGGAIANKEKKCVFTGPVLRDDDPYFDNDGKMTPTKMPCAFWKVEAFKGPNGEIQGEAFLMSQKDFMDKPKTSEAWVHLTPMQLQKYRIPMAELEKVTHLKFGNIQDIPDPTGARGGTVLSEGGE